MDEFDGETARGISTTLRVLSWITLIVGVTGVAVSTLTQLATEPSDRAASSTFLLLVFAFVALVSVLSVVYIMRGIAEVLAGVVGLVWLQRQESGAVGGSRDTERRKRAVERIRASHGAPSEASTPGSSA